MSDSSRGRTTLALVIVLGSLAALALVFGGARPSAADTFPVTGTFVLWDDFPTVDAGELCDAKRSFYHDINRDTAVSAETVGGVEITSTKLGDGTIASPADFLEVVNQTSDGTTLDEVQELFDRAGMQPCVFRFSLELTSGSDDGEGYVIVLGRRGRWELSEARLRQDNVLQLTVGLR